MLAPDHAPVRSSARPRLNPLAWLIQLTWGFPQTLAGAVLFFCLHGPSRHMRYRSAFVTPWRSDAGLSLGPFIFVPRRCPTALIVHEYGHTIQSLMLGPLYLLIIGLPSLIWAGLPALERFRVRRDYSYYRLFTERWANLLVRRVTGERPMGWYDRR